MRFGQVLALSGAAWVLASCAQSMHLTYADPSPDSQTIEAAQAGYQYVQLPRTVVAIAPAASATMTAASRGTGSTQALSPPQIPGSATQAGPTSNASRSNKNNKAGGTSPRSTDAASPSNNASAPLDQSLGTVLINGRPWTARLVGLPDEQSSFAVKANSNFAHTDTLTISRFTNSDLVSSVSSKAVNEIPNRIALVAEVAGAFVKGGLIPAAGLESTATAQPLQPFSFVVGVSDVGPVQLDSGWWYKFNFDSPPPTGSISYTTLRQSLFASASGSGQYGFFPVNACRDATITVSQYL